MGNTFRQKATKRGKHTKGFYNHLVMHLRLKAKHRGIEWNLDPDLVLKLIRMPCYLCGSPPSNRFKSRKKGVWEGRVIVYQGIDRVNNKLGYIVDESLGINNVKPCCIKCNKMKLDGSLSGLKSHIKKIIKYGEGIKLGFRRPIQLKINQSGAT
jgi:hypothetical protein